MHVGVTGEGEGAEKGEMHSEEGKAVDWGLDRKRRGKIESVGMREHKPWGTQNVQALGRCRAGLRPIMGPSLGLLARLPGTVQVVSLQQVGVFSHMP